MHIKSLTLPINELENITPNFSSSKGVSLQVTFFKLNIEETLKQINPEIILKELIDAYDINKLENIKNSINYDNLPNKYIKNFTIETENFQNLYEQNETLQNMFQLNMVNQTFIQELNPQTTLHIAINLYGKEKINSIFNEIKQDIQDYENFSTHSKTIASKTQIKNDIDFLKN